MSSLKILLQKEFRQIFRNRIIYIATETTKIADRTLNAFWQAAKQQQGVTRTAT